MIRVLLVDDQQLVRSGIKSLLGLSQKVEVVAEASHGQEAIGLANKLEIDVILMDIQMPVLDGIQALDGLYQARVNTPVVMLTTFDDKQRVVEAVSKGAKGYLLKDVDLEELVEAIEQVHQGKTLIQPASLASAKLHLAEHTPSTHPLVESAEPLTEKETEVLRLMAAGYSNQEIGEIMHKSTGTIKNQVSSVLAKLGVRDRTRAVLRAIELNLL